ncbi:MAG: DUF4920 domain-containing protein [Bacteroidota bacterium]
MMQFRIRAVAFLILCSTAILVALPKKYGKALTLKEATPVSAILANPGEFDGKLVQVKGLVVDVCQKMGCWIRIAGEEDHQSIQLKVDDGVIVFPVEAKGKEAVVEGIVSVQTLTVDEAIARARHEAEEQGRLEAFDPSTITGPKTLVRLMGEGAVIGE